jgi:tetratricopeptide (TPR) repeat protein/transcriptional regulator with XRE-family HTH domain
MSDSGHGRRFGVLLRLHRSASGLTQEELADLSQLSVRAISDMERSRTVRPHRRSVVRLADALQLSEPDREQLVSASRAAGVQELRRLDEQLKIRPNPELAEAHLRLLLQQAPAVRDGERPRPGGMADRVVTPPVVPRQLPPAVPHFIGRQVELATLTALLNRPGCANDPQPTMVTSTIGGAAGIGKTALAVHWAHEIAEHFPDGQLYVNLRGYHPTARPVGSGEAIRGFLDALNVPPPRIPASSEAQIALYRSLLADRRMLIVLDNARDAQHARPLLPGSADCLVIITSRSQLAGLVAAEGAHLLNLELLPDAEARELLVTRLHTARVAAEPAALHELAQLCAGLPLALSIVAARIAARPGLPLAAFAAELRDNRALLDALDTGDPAASVRAVFSWSYQNLTHQAARMFRLLGVHPGPDISAAAAARLARISPHQARRVLTELASMNILTEHATARFAFHDLLRAYAIEEGRARDSDPDRHAAVCRVLDYYVCTAHEAALLLNPSRDVLALTQPASQVMPLELHDSTEALAWFEAEHAVLLAAIADAATAGLDHHVGQISWSLADYLDRRGHWHDWAATQRFAVAAAQRAGDRAAQARACRGLGRAQTELRVYPDARTHLRHAVDLYGQLRDSIGQGRTHLALARLWEYQNQHAPALDHAQEALNLFRAAGHPPGQASARNAVGWHQAHLGNHTQAINDCLEALALYHSLADTRGEAATSDSLGYAYHHVGNYAQACRCYQAAVDLFRNLGDKYNEASSLSRLGDVHEDAGNSPTALAVWGEALAMLSDLDHPDVEEVRAKLRGRATLLAEGARDNMLKKHRMIAGVVHILPEPVSRILRSRPELRQ